jgi:hypothetical protein
MAQKGLVKQVVYRPAVLNQMNHKRLMMSHAERRIFEKMVQGRVRPEQSIFSDLSVRSKALLLNAYMDYLQYKGMQNEADRQKVNIPRSVLLARSRLQFVSTEDDWITQFSSPPDLGHGADRVRFGSGFNDDEGFLELAYRPAYHDLMARDVGYDKDSEIIFLDFKFRYFFESERLTLDRAKILAITAINPYDPLFAKPSWRLALEIDTLRDRDCNYCNSFKGNFGGGLSYRPKYFSPLLLYSFVDVKTEFSGDLDKDYRLGGDVEIGAFYDLSENWKIKLFGAYQVFVLGDDNDFFAAGFESRFALSQNLDIRFEYQRHDRNNEGIFALNYYF